MKESIKKIAIAVAITLFVTIAIPVVSALCNMSSIFAVDFNGIYGNNTLTAFAQEQVDAEYTMKTGRMPSKDNKYLLLATNIDDVTAYEKVGYEVTEFGKATTKLESQKYYESITVKTNSEGGKKTFEMTDIFPTDVVDGMIVTEITYDASKTYSIKPYMVKNGGEETVYGAEIFLTTAIDDTEIFDGRQSILLMGQSNMAGRGEVGSVDVIDNERIYMQNQSLAWTKMVEPIHYDKPGQAGVGLGASFADAFVNTFDVEVGLVPCAMGGSSIEQWAVGETLYTDAVKRAKAAQADSEICAILWHQGCSNETGYEGYAEKFQTIMDSLMAELDLDKEKIIIVAGELGTFRETVGGADTDGITSEIYRIGEYYDNYAVTSSAGLTAVDKHTHFDGPSQRVFGYRYFANYYNILTGKTFDDFSQDPTDYIKKSYAGFIEAESYSSKSGSGYANSDTNASGGKSIGFTADGDYAVYNNVIFDGTPTSFAVSYAGLGSSLGLELCVDDLNTTLAKIDTLPASPAGSYSVYTTVILEVTYPEQLYGEHDLYLKYNAGYNVDWFEFITGNIFTVEATPSTVTEGTDAQIVVTRWGSANSEKTVDIATVAGTATEGTIFTGVSQTLTFAAGETQKTVSIPTMDTDLTDNGDLYFDVVLSNPSTGSALFTKWTSISVGVTTSAQKVFVMEDTYVHQGNADSNFGSAGSIDIKDQTNTTNRIGLLKFDISKLTVEEGGHIYLVLTLNRHDSNGGAIHVHECVNDWDEMTVTYNTRPDEGTEIGTGAASNLGTPFRYEVTDYVKTAKASGATQLSFMLIGPYNAFVGIDAREAGTGTEAYLTQIVYSLNAGDSQYTTNGTYGDGSQVH